MNREKILLMVMFVMFSALFMTSLSAEAQQKLAFVRSGYILNNYEPYREAIKKYEEYEKAEIEQLQKKAAEFQQKVTDSQKQASFMSEEQLRSRSMELESENANLEKYSQQLYNREGGILANKYADLLKPVFDKINKAIFKIREDEGYAFIFEAESDAVIDADSQYDISGKVIEVLSKMDGEESKEE